MKSRVACCNSSVLVKWLGCKSLRLSKTKPNFNLTQPGGVFREPVHLQHELPFEGSRQFVRPSCQLFGSMRWTVVEDESQGMDVTTARLRNETRLHKGAEVDETFARSTVTVDHSISDTQPCQ
jgi:hypothetical protein